MRRLVIALTGLLTLAGVTVVALYLLVFAAGTDRAARIAPAASALYVNVYLQPSTGQQMELSDLLSRFPGFRDQATLDEKLDQLAQRFLSAAGLDYRADLKPWLGNQLALAVAPGSEEAAAPATMVIVAVRDRAAAEEAAARILADAGEPSPSTSEHRGVQLVVGSSGLGYAFVEEMLVFASTPAWLRQAVDTARGAEPALADVEGFQSAHRRLPTDHLATVFANLRTVSRASGDADGFGGYSEVALALRAEDEGFRLSGFAPFDPRVADGDGRAMFALSSEPSSLTGWMPPETEAAFVVFRLSEMLAMLEAQAAGEPALGDVTASLTQLRALLALGLGIDVNADLLPLLDRELGIAVNGLPATPGGQLLLRPSDLEAAREALGRIEAALEARGGEVATVDGGSGEQIRVVEVPDTFGFAYAIVDGVVVAGLDADAVEEALAAHRSGASLSEGQAYRETFALAGTRGGNEVYVDAQALLETMGDALPLAEQDRDILEPVRTLGVTLPARDDSLEIHLVITIR